MPHNNDEATVELADSILSTARTLAGVGEALYFRAVAEDDDMLAMLADVVNDQVDSLRDAARRIPSALNIVNLQVR
ncbi:MAG: hypothetical protein IJ087_14670 [Eggerthellaceae bacterium]|nr:hypothetical protein [Eggerthellaceae bacterium]